MNNNLNREMEIIHNIRYNDVSIESFIGNLVLLISQKNYLNIILRCQILSLKRLI